MKPTPRTIARLTLPLICLLNPVPIQGEYPDPPRDSIFHMKDGSNEVFSLDDLGNLGLDGFIITNCASISQDGGIKEWLVKDGATILAKVDLSGTMKGWMRIKGNLYEEGSPSTSHVFYVENTTPAAIMSIDSSGNLHLAGNVAPSSLPSENTGAFRNESCTEVLDEWPESGTQLRSAKYIFGESDNIFLRITGPSGLGNTFFRVQVTSESDSTGVPIDLYEVSSGVYRNRSEDGELLRLDDSSSESSPADYIKVVDEEKLTLTFKLRSDGAVLHTEEVMVDRGEFATATARSYDSRPVISNPPDRTPIWLDSADAFKDGINENDKGDLEWWDVGNVRGSYDGTNAAFRSFVLNAGENQANNLESDLFYTHSHGDSKGDLWGTKKQSGDPDKEEWERIIDASEDLDGIWNNDADWAVIKGCSVLNHNDIGRDDWEGALDNSPRLAHGILSFEGASYSDYDAYVDDFMEEIGARHTLITSWINANTPGGAGNQPYGIVYHTENADDVLRPAADGVSLTADVSSSNFSYTWRDSGGTTGTDVWEPHAKTRAEIFAVSWRGLDLTTQVPIIDPAGSFPAISASLRQFPVGPHAGNFNLLRSWKSGRMSVTRDIDLQADSLTVENAWDIAEEFAKRNAFPNEAEMGECTSMWVKGHDGQERLIACTIRMTQRARGTPIAGDDITMIVQANGVTLLSAYWHDISIVESEQVTLTPFDRYALQACADWLLSKYDISRDGPMPNVSYARPAYCVGDVDRQDSEQPRLVWDVRFGNGIHVRYDPDAGKVVDHLVQYRSR